MLLHSSFGKGPGSQRASVSSVSPRFKLDRFLWCLAGRWSPSLRLVGFTLCGVLVSPRHLTLSCVFLSVNFVVELPRKVLSFW